jgi:hypothetical protein
MEFADVGHFMIRERPNLIEEAIIALTQNSPMIGLTNCFKAGEVGFGSDSAIHRCWTARLLYPDERTFATTISNRRKNRKVDEWR